MAGINQFRGTSIRGTNTGAKKLVLDSQTKITQLLITPIDFTFATITSALTVADVITAMKADKADRIYLTPRCDSHEEKSKEPTFFDSANNGMLKMSEGVISFDLIQGTENENLYQKLRGFDNKTVRLFVGDDNKNILCTSSDGTKIKGFEATVYVTARTISDGTKPSQFKITVNIKNSTEWIDEKVVLQPIKEADPWSLNDLDGVYDVDLSATATTIAGTTVKVHIDSYDLTDSRGAITGLTSADFVLKNGSGVTQSITSVTDNGDGTYAVVATIATGYTINLKATSVISLVDLAIESTGVVTLTTS